MRVAVGLLPRNYQGTWINNVSSPELTSEDFKMLFVFCFLGSFVLAHRYAKKTAWEQFFVELLNVESCDKMPDLAKLRNMMEETLAQMSQVQTNFRTFDNILNKR